MRTRATSLALAGVLIASGGALAVAQTAGPGSTTKPTSATAEATTETAATATAEPTAEPSSSSGDEGRTRTPPGWAQRDAAKDKAKDKAKDRERGVGPDASGPGRAHGRGPDATGPAAYGLCRAWASQEGPAAKAEHVPPFRNLAAAAGGVDKVDAYCAALPEREPDDAAADD